MPSIMGIRGEDRSDVTARQPGEAVAVGEAGEAPGRPSRWKPYIVVGGVQALGCPREVGSRVGIGGWAEVSHRLRRRTGSPMMQLNVAESILHIDTVAVDSRNGGGGGGDGGAPGRRRPCGGGDDRRRPGSLVDRGACWPACASWWGS